MSEQLIIGQGTKSERYAALIPQIAALVSHEDDVVACMANVAAALKYTFDFWWVGFYRVVNDALVLGPYQGPLACTRIAYGRGVCGAAWRDARAVVVPDVDAFPGHIACSDASRSEIVVPVRRGDEVLAVIDVDSERLANFDEVDCEYLTEIADMIAQKF